MTSEKQPAAHDFKIGDGVTYYMYSDALSHTVIDVKRNGKEVHVQRDHVERLTKPEFVAGGFAGHCANQHSIEYKCTPDPEGEIMVFTLRSKTVQYGYLPTDLPTKRFYWAQKGSTTFSKNELGAGRHEFYDYNF